MFTKYINNIGSNTITSRSSSFPSNTADRKSNIIISGIRNLIISIVYVVRSIISLILPIAILVFKLKLKALLLVLLLLLAIINISNITKIFVSNKISDSNRNLLLNGLAFIPKFPFYSGDSIVPTWILTNSSYSSTIRFFDSSPFSPTGRYVAFTRVLSSNQNKAIMSGDTATIVVIDLMTSTEIIVDTTNGWDSQLGAQVQWGASDHELIYNTHSTATLNGNNTINGGIGVVTNIFLKETNYLKCGIYHISPDGNYGISPNLPKIKFTQLGYGIHTANVDPNINAPSNDGFYIIDTKNGHCQLLVSLSLLSSLIPSHESCKDNDTPTYGFHAKWSYDGTLIMMVIRTLERQAGTTKSVRRQHLFVADPFVSKLKKNSDPVYVVSWGSKYDPKKCHVNINISTHANTSAIANNKVSDGNHPNWVPFTHQISMNFYYNGNTNTTGHYNIVVFDIDKLNNTIISNDTNYDNKTAYMKQIHPLGSGHPTLTPHGRYVLTDAYPKENKYLQPPRNSNNGAVTVPIRLIDTATGKEIRLMTIPVSKKLPKLELASWFGLQWALRWAISAGVPHDMKIIDHAWRCDSHAVWSKDYRWIALNGMPNGESRQVLIAYIGDIHRLFPTSTEDGANR